MWEQICFSTKGKKRNFLSTKELPEQKKVGKLVSSLTGHEITFHKSKEFSNLFKRKFEQEEKFHKRFPILKQKKEKI